MIILYIACGGAIGAVSRFGLSSLITSLMGHGFPYATITVNILGSLVMGFLIGFFSHYYSPSPEIKAFVITGLLGGFTTFSAFSLDAITLIERNNYIGAGSYVLFSVILSISAVFIGIQIIKGLVA